MHGVYTCQAVLRLAHACTHPSLFLTLSRLVCLTTDLTRIHNADVVRLMYYFHFSRVRLCLLTAGRFIVCVDDFMGVTSPGQCWLVVVMRTE